MKSVFSLCEKTLFKCKELNKEVVLLISSHLKDHGYDFEKRGHIEVKGKGQMLTHFLISSPETNVTVENEANNFVKVRYNKTIAIQP